jgi:hypothetical protein
MSPSIDMPLATASAICSGSRASNRRWVQYRWFPSVTPNIVNTYSATTSIHRPMLVGVVKARYSPHNPKPGRRIPRITVLVHTGLRRLP